MRDQKEGRVLRWLVGFNSRTGGQTLRGALKIWLHDGKNYIPSLHPPRTCTELRCLRGLRWARSEGQKNKGACSTTIGLNSTEAGCFRLLRDPDAGRHTCGTHIHVHIEDSKSLPSLAPSTGLAEMGMCPLRVNVGRGKEVPPFHVLQQGKGLKIKANLTTPMTNPATTACTTAEHEQEHRDTGAEWRGALGTGACRLVIAYLPPGS